MEVKTIAGFTHGLGSGLSTVHFTDGTSIYTESGYGIRTFAHAFGGLNKAVGKKIEIFRDDLMPDMLLAGFNIVEEEEKN